jgi:branched-chain amino acid transport system ATP-binding protein
MAPAADAHRRSYPYRSLSHPARGRSCRSGGRRERPARPQWRRQDHHACAPSWGCGRPSSGEIHFDGTPSPAGHTPTIARWHCLCAGEHGDLHRPDRRREHAAWPRRKGPFDPKRLPGSRSCSRRSATFWNKAAGTLSGGQKQMLSVARAIIEPRRLILIDEPTKGLAPAIINAMTARSASSRKPTRQSCWWNRISPWPPRIGDTVSVMDDGRVMHAGDMAELAGDSGMQERLMGLSLEAHQ